MSETYIDTLPICSTTTNAEEVLDRYLSRLRLRRSMQRSTILQVFLDTRESLTMLQLHDRVREVNSSISYATVYRSLALFIRCGLAAKFECVDGIARFGNLHHQASRHQIHCTICGSATEFTDLEAEKIGQRVGKQLRFAAILYNYDIYGICENCIKEQQH